MSLLLAKILAWVGRKLVLFLFLFTLFFLLFAISRVPDQVEAHLERNLKSALEELESVEGLAGDLRRQAESMRGELMDKKQHLENLHADLQRLQRWWDRAKGWVGLGPSEKEIESLKAKAKETEQSIGEAERRLEEFILENAESEEEIQQRKALIEGKESQLRDLKNFRIWLNAFIRENVYTVAGQAALVLLLLIALPLLWKVVAFHFLAPLAEKAPPIELVEPEERASVLPTASENQPAQRITLAKGQELAVKESFLQSSTDTSIKRTKWLLDSAYPFTSLASSQYFLTSIRPDPEAADKPVQVTISCQVGPMTELAVIELAAGEELVFRPSFLVGLLWKEGQPPRIRSRWVFNRLHAWITLRFRYLLIGGPVQLVLAAQRGVQCETVEVTHSGRRINSDLTVAFTPSLRYRPRRAETFWAYFRGANPLFDDFFQGTGVTLNQQVGGGLTSGVRRLWEGVFSSIGKIFGL